MESMDLGYELRIGNSYDYAGDTAGDAATPCKLINILHDGHYVVYEIKFAHGIGATIYPNKLKPHIHEHRQA